MPFLLNSTNKTNICVFPPMTVKSIFINKLMKPVFTYIYLKVGIETLPLKVVLNSKADLASLGQSDIDMLSQFLSFSFNEDCT